MCVCAAVFMQVCTITYGSLISVLLRLAPPDTLVSYER